MSLYANLDIQKVANISERKIYSLTEKIK